MSGPILPQNTCGRCPICFGFGGTPFGTCPICSGSGETIHNNEVSESPSTTPESHEAVEAASTDETTHRDPFHAVELRRLINGFRGCETLDSARRCKARLETALRRASLEISETQVSSKLERILTDLQRLSLRTTVLRGHGWQDPTAYDPLGTDQCIQLAEVALTIVSSEESTGAQLPANEIVPAAAPLEPPTVAWLTARGQALGQEIKRRRKEKKKHLTAEEFAKTQGVDKATLLRWEKGDMIPSKDHAKSLSETLDWPELTELANETRQSRRRVARRP